MLGGLGKLGQLLDSNERELRKISPVVSQISSLEPQMRKLKETGFASLTEKFRDRLDKGETLDGVLPEAFAALREAVWREIGLRAYDEQMMAAIAFHQGRIAEQKTGEGKTLSAIFALYLNALTSRGVHLVTVNDYLARRDAGWNGPAYHLVGLSVGVIVPQASYLYDPEYEDRSHDDERLAHLRPVSKKEAYQADITYGTNAEFGFDYLRDNMVGRLEDMNQRGHHFAIVDEVDSILIDEARTPLIISAPDTEPTQKYYDFARLIKTLSPDTDYTVDEKAKTASLTEHGIKKVEKRLGVDNIYEKDFETLHLIEQSLRAQTLFARDRDYVVKDGQVIIVDEHTGRLMFGRRYSEGLHQAIEANEGVQIQQESRTLATISIQNYFRMYEKLSGMTGTAATEAEEFEKIYKLDVLVVPTHKPMIRQDYPDVVYKNTRAKYAAIVREIEEKYKAGQPVLVGTRSIEKNEIVSDFLRHKKIPHNVLNAKNHEKEASIIAQAGEKAAVTVATNIAGRGVDIVLGGAPPEERGDKKAWQAWQKEHEEVVKVGGLHLVGTERHEARRIDNQLRGRSGRQGDPGSSRFFVALDDDIMRIFGGEQVAGLMTRFQLPEDQPLEHAMVSKAIEQAQSKVEGFHFDARKHLVEYDDVMNKQREIIYGKRREVLQATVDGEKGEASTVLKEELQEKIAQEVANLVVLNWPREGEPNFDQTVKDFAEILPFDEASQRRLKNEIEKQGSPEKNQELLTKVALDAYGAREKQVSPPLMRQIERFVILSTIDHLWMDHLDSMDDLREGIGLRSYGQRNPLTEYKNEAFTSFERLMAAIDHEAVRRVFRVAVRQEPPAATIPVAQATAGRGAGVTPAQTKNPALVPETPQTQAAQAAAQGPVRKQKIGRNDPCWCGSGKKWKKCHYPQLPSA